MNRDFPAPGEVVILTGGELNLVLGLVAIIEEQTINAAADFQDQRLRQVVRHISQVRLLLHEIWIEQAQRQARREPPE